MWLKLILGLIISYLYVFVIKTKHSPPATEEKLDNNGRKLLRPPNVEVPQPPSMSTLHVYPNAAVCSDKSSCSNIGRIVMEHGGNAVDSAIATLLCNGLVTMQSMGLGGGVLMTYYSEETKQAYCIMGRERAPGNLSHEYLKHFKSSSSLAKSVLAIAVPAEVAAYHEAHARFGSLPWQYIMRPTVDMCYNGYHITRHQRDALYLNEERIRSDAMLSSMFIDPTTQKFYREGSHITVPKQLCETYNILAQEGPASFYNGTLSSLIVHDLQDMGSLITAKDLRELRVNVIEALRVDLGEFLLFVPPPPGSGHVLAHVMQILRNFKGEFSQLADFSAADVHRIVEALKFGFVKRWEYDTEIDQETLKLLISLEYATNKSHLIDDIKTYTSPKHYGASVELMPNTDYGTAQIAVLSPNGDAVSATSSINYYFGSGRMGARTGILFNNAISDFTIDHLQNYFDLPNIQNRNVLKPQQQPMSSMVPLIVTHKDSGEVRLVTGAAGGSRIISTLAQILVRVLWMNKNIKQSIDYARFHHQLLPNILEYEFGILQQVIEELEAKGHTTERIRRKNTAVCGVEKMQGVVLANVDYRKEGGVDGF